MKQFIYHQEIIIGDKDYTISSFDCPESITATAHTCSTGAQEQNKVIAADEQVVYMIGTLS